MSRILGRSPVVLVAARAGRARLPRKKWRRERVMVNYKYKPLRSAFRESRNSARAAFQGRRGGSFVLRRIALGGRAALRGKWDEGTGSTVTFFPAMRKIFWAKSNQLAPPLLVR